MVVHATYPQDARVAREARAAAQAGASVDVICLVEADDEPRHEILDEVRVHRVGISRRRGVGLHAMLAEYVGFAIRASLIAARLRIRNRGAAEHIVQVHAPPDFLIVAGLLPKLLGSRLILDIHDLSRHLYLARFGQRRAAPWAARILAAVERTACSVADQVITVHEPYRQELVANGADASRVAVVMNAVDDALLASLPSAATNGSGHAPGAVHEPFTIAYHGSILPTYGVDLIVEALPLALAEIPKLRCMIIGGGDGVPKVVARAEQLRVADRIEFSRGFVPIETALAKVATADCGLIPNRPSELNRFALSSKLFEYVALGLPAVVARLETLAEHFDPDEVTFFDPGDAASLAAAIAWVARNPAEARSKASRALARSREYSWSAQRQRYLGVLGAR